MNSLKFPKMFNSNSTRVWKSAEHLQATKQNTMLLLKSERGELLGDPYFGLMIKHYLFEQNSYVLKDMIIDTIYNQLALFIPQVRVDRNDIELIQNYNGQKGSLVCSFKGINQITFEPDTYNLVLYTEADMAI